MAKTTKSDFEKIGWTITNYRIENPKKGEWIAAADMTNEQGRQGVYLISAEDGFAYYRNQDEAKEAVAKWKST